MQRFCTALHCTSMSPTCPILLATVMHFDQTRGALVVHETLWQHFGAGANAGI
jgi:hypothetical protein